MNVYHCEWNKAEMPVAGWRILGLEKEFSKSDKLIYLLTYAWILGWVAVFIVGTIYYFTVVINDVSWMMFWYYCIWINLVASIIVTIWFSIGGANDIRRLFQMLKTLKRDVSDNGMVRSNEE